MKISKNEFIICTQFEKNVFIGYLWTKSHNDIVKVNVGLENIFTVFTEIPPFV